VQAQKSNVLAEAILSSLPENPVVLI